MNSTRSRPRAGTMSASVVTARPSISISVRWSTGLLSATAQTMGDAYQRQRVESAVLEQGTADGLTAVRQRVGRHRFVESGLRREAVLHVDEQRVVELGIDGRKHRLERVRAVERGVTVVIAGEAQQVDEAPHDRLERRGEVGEQARHLHQAPLLEIVVHEDGAFAAETLLATLGSEGPIFVYHDFEKWRLMEMARMFPYLAPPLEAVMGRFVDLLRLTRDHYRHPALNGSYSLKTVLPTIDPELDHALLIDVQDGLSAQAAFHEAMAPDTPADRREAVRRSLLEYCALDTLALVRVAHRLGSG